MRLKSGVQWTRMAPAMEHAWDVCERVTREVCDRDAIITSARDGRHSANSFHYEGRALDLRTRDLTVTKVAEYHGALVLALGPDYDVVTERDHIHLEFDPK